MSTDDRRESVASVYASAESVPHSLDDHRSSSSTPTITAAPAAVVMGRSASPVEHKQPIEMHETQITSDIEASKTISNDFKPHGSNSGGIELMESEIETTTQSGPGAQYRTYKRRWYGILSLALMNIVNSWGWLSFAAISNYTADHFNLASESPVNWLSTVILFSYIVISPLVWWVIAKKNIRWALIICGVLSIIGNWLRYAGTAKKLFGLTMFGQILIGFSQPFALSSVTHYTDLWFTSRSRVSANAIASLANPLGGAIAQLVGPSIVYKASDLPTFILVTAGVATGCSLTTLLVPAVPPLPPCPSSAIVKLSLRESFVRLMNNWRFIAIFILFSVYVGFFNAFSTYINQIMEPYGYSSDEAGIAGAILIIAGIVFSAISSPIIDRTHRFLLYIQLLVPMVAACYIGAIFMASKSGNIAGPYVVCALLGLLSFSLLPVFLEWNQEQTSPVDPAVSSSLLWIGGQFFGAIFIIIMNALKYPEDQGNPPANMRRALIFEAVIACVAVLPIWFIRNQSNNLRISLDEKPR
ncbi:hypothetical protein TRVA0_009S00452 [Trichomonascus vanleenenianus]|uniref:uncharacterized protein n=1 Tax=Trichomonascus vanleenenianus TaxID=2268995 RepID=UPI003ECAD019